MGGFYLNQTKIRHMVFKGGQRVDFDAVSVASAILSVVKTVVYQVQEGSLISLIPG